MTELADLMTIVGREIAVLRKNIGKHESDLEQLKKQLELHERIAAMLTGRTAARKATRQPPPEEPATAPKKSRVRKKGSARTNWNDVLEGLPASFTVAQVKEAAGKASNAADVHQALLRWRQAGSVVIIGRGQYKRS